MRPDHYEKFYPKEYFVEELHEVVASSGPYLYIKWYVEDPDPDADWYLTEIGSSPKNRSLQRGKLYMVSGYSWIAKN